MESVTHEIQFFEIDLANGCRTLADFYSMATLAFEASSAQLETSRLAARKQDEEEGGAMPDEFPDATYKEFPIACEQGALHQAYSLLGPLCLVYLTSQVESFLGNVVECCGWKVNEAAGSNLRKYISAIETYGKFRVNCGPVSTEYLEELWLARNAVTHARGAFKRYMERIPPPRYVDSDRNSVAIAAEDVAEAAKKLAAFAKFITSRCLALSKPFP